MKKSISTGSGLVWVIRGVRGNGEIVYLDVYDKFVGFAGLAVRFPTSDMAYGHMCGVPRSVISLGPWKKKPGPSKLTTGGQRLSPNPWKIKMMKDIKNNPVRIIHDSALDGYFSTVTDLSFQDLLTLVDTCQKFLRHHSTDL